MQIEEHQISLAARHQLSTTRESRQDLQVWDNRGTAALEQDKVSISAWAGNMTAGGCDGGDHDNLLSVDPKYYFLALLIEKLTGKKISIPEMSETQTAEIDAVSTQDAAGSGGALEGWGVRYSSVETYTENEQTVFEAKGALTADGRDISFSLSLTMARSYTQSESFEFRAGDAVKDPLVINLADTFAQLQPGDTVRFDLDLDGADDAMPFLASGSGFLVIDNNGNGVVDNGSELFGPATGNGFQELSAYDEDNNGWIDEGDSAYARMGVWRRLGEQNVLQSLGELDIGAIYAGNITTPFEITDSGNNTLGHVRQTGLYVRNDMTVGTVQKLDIVV
jgi:hypothetical protein